VRDRLRARHAAGIGGGVEGAESANVVKVTVGVDGVGDRPGVPRGHLIVQLVGEQLDAGVEEYESVLVPEGEGVPEAGHHQNPLGDLLGASHDGFHYGGRLAPAGPHLIGQLENRGGHDGSFRRGAGLPSDVAATT
jgi:hypothetical protein